MATTPAKSASIPASKIPVKAPVAKKVQSALTPTAVAAKSAATVAAKTPKLVKTSKVKVNEVKVDKIKKPKLVRDSFTIPKPEYAVLEALKDRAARAGVPAKKSELLRAGIKALAGMTDAAFLAALGAVPAIKTGRPAKN